MSIDYSAILAVGKVFDTTQEAMRFLQQNGFEITDEEMEMMAIDDYVPTGMIYGDLNCFTGAGGYYLGFPIRCSSIKVFVEDFKNGKFYWDTLFTNDPADIIHEVVIS